MWIISKTGGFLSAVQHNADPDLLRVRARRHRDLAAAFPSMKNSIIDLRKGGGYFDYQWHLDVPRSMFAAYVGGEIANLDYEGHVKESVTDNGADKELYRAMMRAWDVFYDMQERRGSHGDLLGIGYRPTSIYSGPTADDADDVYLDDDGIFFDPYDIEVLPGIMDRLTELVIESAERELSEDEQDELADGSMLMAVKVLVDAGADMEAAIDTVEQLADEGSITLTYTNGELHVKMERDNA